MGSIVRIKDRGFLESFKKEWTYHNPLKSKQLAYAGKEGRVAEVAFYHGGDVLYTIDGMPSIWHEQCLESPMRNVPNKSSDSTASAVTSAAEQPRVPASVASHL